MNSLGPKFNPLKIFGNTYSEIWGRLAIIGFTALIAVSAFLTGANFAAAHFGFLLVIGKMSTAKFNFLKLIYGIIALCCNLGVIIVMIILLLKEKSGESLKSKLIINIVLLAILLVTQTIFLVGGITIHFYSITIYAFVLMIVAILGLIISYKFFYRNVRQQWRIRRLVEYKKDCQDFTASENISAAYQQYIVKTKGKEQKVIMDKNIFQDNSKVTTVKKS